MKNNYCYFLIAMFGLTSCKPMMYIQRTENVPLLEEKGEIVGSFNGSNFQGAYALTDNIGLIASVQMAKKTRSLSSVPDTIDATVDWSAEWVSKRTAIAIGAGTYTKLNEFVVAEVYGGATFGNSDFENFSMTSGIKDYSRSLNAPFAGFFIQPNIGYKDEIVDLAFSTRLVGFSFTALNLTNYTAQNVIYDEIGSIQGPLFLFLEPAITGRLGYQYVKGQLQIGYSYNLSNHVINYNRIFAKVGIVINIATRWRIANNPIPTD